MHVDPRIGALRGDRAAQGAMREAVSLAVEDCRRESTFSKVIGELEDYGAGAELAECAALQRLVGVEAAARAAILPMIERLIGQQREMPLAQLAFRHQSGAGFHFLQLAARGSATLGLALHDGTASASSSPIATFPDAERHEIVLAGGAEIELLRIVAERPERVEIVGTARHVGRGDCIVLADARCSRVVRRVRGYMLGLRLARVGDRPRPTRQVDLASGRVVHQASGNRRESQHEMMVALLGRMNRSDAAPVLADIARSGSDHLRWQALRECLALNTGLGMDLLGTLASDPSDPLCSPANGLLAQLVERYPELKQAEGMPPCRA